MQAINFIQGRLNKKGIPARVIDIKHSLSKMSEVSVDVKFSGRDNMWHMALDAGKDVSLKAKRIYIIHAIEREFFRCWGEPEAIKLAAKVLMRRCGVDAWLDVMGEWGGRSPVFVVEVWSQENGCQREYIGKVIVTGPDDPKISEIVRIAAKHGENDSV
ncbi:hypothetical protein [Profundibacter sp.]